MLDAFDVGGPNEILGIKGAGNAESAIGPLDVQPPTSADRAQVDGRRCMFRGIPCPSVSAASPDNIRMASTEQ